MPPLSSYPEKLRPFIFHGVRLEQEEGSDQAYADCPFCGKEGKFTVKAETGQWRCFVCGQGTDKGGGNIYTFIRKLWDESDKATEDYADILESRRLLYPETLMAWGVCRSILTEEWLLPGYGADGKLNQLYRYALERESGAMKLYPTPGLGHQLHGVNLFDPKKPDVYIQEGPWDGMALWECLRALKRADGKFTTTSNIDASMLSRANVLAAPGVNVWDDKWCRLLIGKRVFLGYDSDHPRTVCAKCRKPFKFNSSSNKCPKCEGKSNGKMMRAGYDGMKRVAVLCSKQEEPPREIHCLQWGEDGYDHDLPSGYDVRDMLTQDAETMKDRAEQLDKLLKMYKPMPKDWMQGRSEEAVKKGKPELESIECTSWKTVLNAARKALKMTSGLDAGLAVAFAVVVSTKAPGDQLWCKLIGPPSCGKSTICEAISVNRKHIKAISTIRGFHSGYRETSSDKEDNSLLAQLKDMTLVTKDGDTLLKSPNRDQVLSEARDIYDGTSRTYYRNKASRDYENYRMTWLLCGTGAMRELDSSELGERFLDCVIMEGIDEDMEDEVSWRVANRADRIMSLEADGTMEGQHDPDMVNFMQLAGGYVGWLRANARDLFNNVTATPDQLRQCIKLAKFVAFMRARPSTLQDETAEREFSARLVSQHVRLAKSLAVALNRTTLDEEVMRRVRKVALDTARGRTLEIAKCLRMNGRKRGSSVAEIAIRTHHGEDKERSMLKFMRKIGSVELFEPKAANGKSKKPRWRMTERMEALYDAVMGVEEHAAT